MAAYVHYPTVSTDMLKRVWTGSTMCGMNTLSMPSKSVRNQGCCRVHEDLIVNLCMQPFGCLCLRISSHVFKTFCQAACGDPMCQHQVPGRRYNNDERIANSLAKSAVKLVYYYAFATLYGLAGSWANVRALPEASHTQASDVAAGGSKFCQLRILRARDLRNVLPCSEACHGK